MSLEDRLVLIEDRMPEFDGMRERVVAIEQGMWQAQQTIESAGGECSVDVEITVLEVLSGFQPVEGATVVLTWLTPPYDVQSGETDADGFVSLHSDLSSVNASVVVDITKSGYVDFQSSISAGACGGTVSETFVIDAV